MRPAYRLLESIGRRDLAVLIALTEYRGRWLTRFMGAITHLGDALTIITTCLVMLTAPVPDLRAAGFAAAFSLMASHITVQLLKRLISRPRPSLPAGACLIEPPDRFSFPSGHAAAALSVALPLAGIVTAPAAAVLLAVAVLVGLSRCYLGVHYPGDVLAGWMLALVADLLYPLILA